MTKVVKGRELDKLSLLKDKPLIKVITGVRRCGKSTLLMQFAERLREQDQSTPVISINLDAPEFRFLAERDWKGIYDYLVERLQAGRMNYLFIDEIQNVPQFEKLLEGLFVTPNVDLYVTGSNAYLLSSELATLLTGRAMEINLLPFSFVEYLEFTSTTQNIDRAFASYMRTGGFPEAIHLAQADQTLGYEYLKMVFESIYHNDILRRHTIYHETTYNELVDFLIDSVGNSVSARSIADTLTTGGRKIDNKTVSKYIDTLTEAYLFYKVSRYDVKGKQHLATLEKYYPVDMGLRYALLGKQLAADAGHLLENAIFLELRRRGNRVWVGKADQLEVDFVCRDPSGDTRYIQVAQTVSDPRTLERELASFARIPDYNERLLITMDHQSGNRNGIRQLNAIDWLLER